MGGVRNEVEEFNKKIKFYINSFSVASCHIRKKMGNSFTSSDPCDMLNKYWQPIGPSLYCNKATQQVIREKKMTFRTEDEMKYVFNCLLKRINNYHPNVVKIVYLRKLSQSSLCDCGKKFVVLVYVEHVGLRVKEVLEGESKVWDGGQVHNGVNQHRCPCISVLKAAQYLKEQYGAFRVTESNTWIETCKNISETKSSSHYGHSPEAISEQPPNVKVKLWISCEEEQNFPDYSCEEKEMVLSIVELIQHTLVPSKLCRCYSSPEVLDKYLAVQRLNELADKIRHDHKSPSESLAPIKTNPNSQTVLIEQPPFQRNVRSFSSNQPGYHTHTHGSHQKIHDNYQQGPQRKYTSIEYVRKQPVEYLMPEKKVYRAPYLVPEVTPFFSPTAKPFLLQQPPQKHHSFQIPKTHQNVVKVDHSLTKNQYKTIVKFQAPQPLTTSKTPPTSYQQLKSIHPFNPKLRFRHGNNFYNRPIIGIADMSAEISPNIPSINFQSQHQTPKDQTTQKTQSPSGTNQLPTDRKNGHKQEKSSKVLKINLEEDFSKKHVEITLDKGTNPTDRSKIDISFKGEQKKQASAISTSRNNIAIIPISLDSTSGATESLKPFMQSQDQIFRPNSTPASGESQIPSKKHVSYQEKSKKESGSSSKSEQNFLKFQVNLSQSKPKEELSKFFPRQRLSNQQEQSVVNESRLQKSPSGASSQRQKSHSFIKKIDTLVIVCPDGEMGRLRQSEYISSGVNSMMNSQSMSIKEENNLFQQSRVEMGPFKEMEQFKEMGSLKEMEARFPTLQDLQNYEDVGSKRSDSHLFNENSNYSSQSRQQQILISYTKRIHGNDNRISQQHISQARQQQILISYTKPLIIKTPHQSGGSSFLSNKKSSNISLIQNPKPKSHSFSSNYNPNDPRAPIPTEHLQHNLGDQMTSMIMRENQEPLVMQRVTEEEYRVKVSSGIDRQKMHQKKMSNPTFDKQYMKAKALKQEFGQLLADPKENSSKALTQSKDKMATLDRNQGRQTYSIYNESEYTTSEQHSKRPSRDYKMAGSGPSHPPMPGKQHGKQSKWRKPFSKQELQKELQEKKEGPKTPPNQQALRLTSSGHEDNSIKQKVRNKKAEFAELKNEMNSLLL